MAKDNVPFHSIFFPSTLVATQKPWNFVNSLNGIHYLLYENQKFSKSKNIGIFGDQVEQCIDFDVDFMRLYLISIRPETRDSNFQWSEFFDFYQNVVLANVGNLVNRCLSFAKKNFGSEIPVYKEESRIELDTNFVNSVNESFLKYKEYMDSKK